MKKCFVFSFLTLLFLAAVSGATVNVAVSLKTGDADLDLHLRSTNERASTPAGMAETHNYLTQNYSLQEKEINFLHKRGYTIGEIEYLALLAKQSGKSVNSVAALHSKGVGWGVLAKRLGVQPSALRKLIVSRKKADRMDNRGPKIEKTVVKEKIVIKEQYRPAPVSSPSRPASPGGGGKGHGR